MLGMGCSCLVFENFNQESFEKNIFSVKLLTSFWGLYRSSGVCFGLNFGYRLRVTWGWTIFRFYLGFWEWALFFPF